MGVPEEDLPHFPAAAAEALAAELDRVAGDLEQMLELRARAGGSLPEFQGTTAEQYRRDLDTYTRDVAGTIDDLHQTARRLRAAAADNRADRRRLLTLAAT